MTQRITLVSQDQILFVSPDDILYCKCNNSSTTFYMQNGESFIISKGMAVVSKMLEAADFIQPHQSYLVNKKHIVRVDKADDYLLILSNQQKIPTATRRRKELLANLKSGI